MNTIFFFFFFFSTKEGESGERLQTFKEGEENSLAATTATETNQSNTRTDIPTDLCIAGAGRDYKKSVVCREGNHSADGVVGVLLGWSKAKFEWGEYFS